MSANRKKKAKVQSKTATVTGDKKALVQEFLKSSLTDGSFIDTKFYAFSRRRSTGVVDDPLPVYANSGMLCQSSKYFSGFFDAGFQVKIAPLRAPFPSDQPASTNEYDYGSDSDLEDDNEDDVAPEAEEIKDEDNSNVDPLTHTNNSGSAKIASDDSHSTVSLLDESIENHGHVIIVPDVAFTTWKALIFWIYTGQVTFAKLKSQSVSDGDQTTSEALNTLECSPKSMYRLADKACSCGLDELKKLALDNIRSRLSTENIVVELRSTLPSLYTEVRNVLVEFACGTAQTVVTAFVPQWIDELAAGKLVESADTLKAVYKESIKAAAATAAATAAPSVPNWNTNRCGSCRRNSTLNMSNWYRYCNVCGAYSVPNP